jgi:hypothetical protein
MTSAAHADMALPRRSQAVALLGKRWCVPRRNPDPRYTLAILTDEG